MPQFQQQIERLQGQDTSMIMRAEPTPAINWNTSPLASIPELKREPPLPPLPFTFKNSQPTVLLFFIYFGVVIMWSIFYQSNFKTVKNILVSFVSNNALLQMLNERKSFNGFVSVGLFLLGLLVISIFSYQSLTVISPIQEKIQFTTSPTYIFVVLAIFISATFIKSLVIGLSSWVFNKHDAFSGYLSLNVNSIQILGISLLPLSILFTYSYYLNSLWIVRFGMFFITAVFLYRLTRTFFLALKETNSQVFHIILYICALEILPLLGVSKLILDY